MRGWILVVFLLGAAGVGWGCTIFPTVVEAGPEFAVALDSSTGVGVGGVRVVLRQVTGRQLEAVTDGRGVARFRGVPDGAYDVRAAADAAPVHATSVHVKRGRPAGARVKLDWPGLEPVRARGLRGFIWLQYEGRLLPHKGMRVDLREAYSGKLLESTAVGGDGRFGFQRSEAGLDFQKRRRVALASS